MTQASVTQIYLIQKLNKKTITMFGHLIQPVAWKRSRPIHKNKISKE